MALNSDLVMEIAGAFKLTPVEISSLPDDDPLKTMGRTVGDTVTGMVHFLRALLPNPRINRLMMLVWDLIGQRVTPLAMGPEVPTMTFGVVGTKDSLKGIIFAPHHWLQMVEQDRMFQLGAIVFVGYQAADFYHGRLQNGDTSDHMHRRARAYEAEFIRMLMRKGASINDYQKQLLVEFPEGLDSPSVAGLIYDPKPFVTPS